MHRSLATQRYTPSGLPSWKPHAPGSLCTPRQQRFSTLHKPLRAAASQLVLRQPRCRRSCALKHLSNDSLEPQIFTVWKTESSAHVAGQMSALESRKPHCVRTAENVLGRRYPNHSKMFGASGLPLSMETCWCSRAWSQNTQKRAIFR